MTQAIHHIGILGAGAWGTALAMVLTRAGRDVTVWAHDPAVAAAVQSSRINAKYLPDIALDPRIQITAQLDDIQGCDAVILATPAQHLRAVVAALPDVMKATPRPIIITSKGIEQISGLLLGEVVAAELPDFPVTILSGPSFAIEIARGQPAALTLATRDQTLGAVLMQALASPAFRLYHSDDVIGAQIGGAVKNTLAIACGITAGRELGENARAALITRGLAEMMRLGVAVGGRAETLMGLSGLGDLVLTCSSAQSRNMSLGVALGQGQKLDAVLAARSSVAEGVTTAKAALALAKKFRVDMPIVGAVAAVLDQTSTIDAMIAELLARPLKSEQN